MDTLTCSKGADPQDHERTERAVAALVGFNERVEGISADIAWCVALHACQCGEEAARYLPRLPVPLPGTADRGLWEALRYRLGHSPANGVDKAAPAWLARVLRGEEEPSHPTAIVAVGHTCRGEVPVLLLQDICPCCHRETALSPRSPLLRRGMGQSAHWLCPHCLVRREWDALAIREYLWGYFKQQLESAPQLANGHIAPRSAASLFALARALWPVAPLSFGFVDPREFGHLIKDMSVFLNMKAQGQVPPSQDFFCVDAAAPVSNAWLLEKWKSVVSLSPRVVPLAHMAKGTLLEQKALVPPTSYATARDTRGTAPQAQIPFSFTLEEHRRARLCLQEMGVPPGAEFVCLNVREPAYWQGGKAYWHDQQDLRFDDVERYRGAVEYLVEQGYHVLRMGASVAAPLPWKLPCVVDYATRCRSEFMDVWLFANCCLYLGTESGPRHVAAAFKRPAVITRYTLADRSFTDMLNALLVPLELRHEQSGELVTDIECIRRGLYAHTFLDSAALRAQGIVCSAPSPDDILGATREKLAMLRGSWRTTPLLEKLQRRYMRRALLVSLGTVEERRQARRRYLRLHGAAVPSRVFSGYLLREYAQEQANLEKKRRGGIARAAVEAW